MGHLLDLDGVIGGVEGEFVVVDLAVFPSPVIPAPVEEDRRDGAVDVVGWVQPLDPCSAAERRRLFQTMPLELPRQAGGS